MHRDRPAVQRSTTNSDVDAVATRRRVDVARRVIARQRTREPSEASSEARSGAEASTLEDGASPQATSSRTRLRVRTGRPQEQPREQLAREQLPREPVAREQLPREQEPEPVRPTRTRQVTWGTPGRRQDFGKKTRRGGGV